MIGRMAVQLYLTAGRLAELCAGSILNWRLRRGKEDPGRLQERFGIASRQRAAGHLIWVHAASVGETNAVIPLIEQLLLRGFQVLLTTGTVTSAGVAAQRLPDGALHQYIPLDIRRYVERFLDHWQPALAVFVESEIWPAVIRCLDNRDVPLALVNGRLSDRSYRSWRRSGPVGRAVMSGIGLCVAQSAEDARRYSDIGIRTVEISGNLKFDVPAPEIDADRLADWQSRIGDRPVLVAASTHPGEETIIANAHRILRESCSDLLTIIVPRHPDRGDELKRVLDGEDFDVARRSTGDHIGPLVEILLADTVGEMGLWYRLGTIIIIGGSLVPRGGQNPIESAKLGKPVLHGPHVANFRDIFKVLDDSEAAIEVDGSDELAETVRKLLSDTEQRIRLGERARQCVEAQTGALDRTIAALSPILDHLTHAEKTDGPGA